MIKINHTAPIGHVETNPARKEWAIGYFETKCREFTGTNASADAMAWVREVQAMDRNQTTSP